MSKYQNAKIYKIVNDALPDLVYYGSTIDKLWSRFGRHNRKFSAWKKGSKCYYTSFKLIEAGNTSIVLVEKYPCNDKIELKSRERWYIENNDCVNKVIPCRTVKEWREDNKEILKEKNKEYREANKEYYKEYYKEYNEINKEKLKEYKKEYGKKTSQCLCDGEQHKLGSKSKHIRSQYHIRNLKTICDIAGVDSNEL